VFVLKKVVKRELPKKEVGERFELYLFGMKKIGKGD
jgi:hypothetical protein